MKRQTRRMKDVAKRGLVGLLTVSMCLSNVQGIAFADNRVEVGGVKVDGKKVTLNLNGGSLMEAARAALADANVYDDTYIAVSKDAKTQAAYRALTDGSNPLYELALFSDGELQALEDAGVEIVALIQMDQKQAEAAGNLMPATASEIERSSTKVEFFDPSKDEGKEILLYQPDSLFAGFYDQFSNQLMNASEKEIADADPTTYELSGDEKLTFLFINHADAGRTFNLELNGKSLEKGIKVAKAESVIKGVMSTLDVSGIDETLETPVPETTAAAETGAAVTEPSSEAAAQPTDAAATEPSTETAIEPSTEASGNAGESTVILPETGATAESGEIETSAAAETNAAATQPTEANAETGLPAEGQTSTENTEQPAAEKTAAAAENTGIVDTVKEVIETIAENANATMMKIERRLGVIRAEAAESDEAVVEAPKADEAPKSEENLAAGTENEAPKLEENLAAGTENEAPKSEENLAAGTENENPKTEGTPAAGTENEAPKPEETPAAGTENEAPKPEETPAAGTGIETPNPEEIPAAGTGIEAPKTEETTAAEIETTAAVKTDMDIALENDRKALLRETRAADLVDSSVASARVLQYTLDDLSKSFWSAEITDRYEVNVFAEDNAFTESVKLELKELAKPEEAEDGSLAVSEDTLNEKQVEALKADGVYENSQSLDIRFVNAAGEEVEPSSAVKVRIKVYKEALPEDADISTMAIRHLDEKTTDAVNVDTVAEYREDATSDHGTIKPVDGDGKVTELQTVDAENADEETAAIAETATESKKVLPEEAVAVESTFTVNSFSRFTITFGTKNESKSATVKFVDASYSEINTNATLKDIGGNSTITELDFSKYAADYNNYVYTYYGWNHQPYGFHNVQLERDGQRTAINSKLKKITEGKETKWQYSNTEGTGFIQNSDTIYVVYDKGIELTTVETVDSDDKGFYLYMQDYNGPATIGAGAYKTDGSITPGGYSSTIGVNQTWPKTVKTKQSLSNWFNDNDSYKVNNLFIRSVYDETGYYYYNSAEYFATLGTLDTTNWRTNYDNTFTVYNQLGSPSNEDKFYFKRGNFMPYNTLNTANSWMRNLYKDLTLEDTSIVKLSDTDPRYNEALYGFNETADFYFGMYGTAEFYQPVDGKVNDQNMIYEFTGDDDMVVYIDGILVLDLGGIHDAQTGRINFATGEVYYTTTANEKTFNKNRTTIKAQFENALKTNGSVNGKKTYYGQTFDQIKWKGNTFEDNSLHRIQFFYMERGAGASNLKLKVNIPTIPKGSVTVQKRVEGLKPEQAKNETYTLQLKTRGKRETSFRSGEYTYTLSTENNKIDHPTKDGKFVIHGNEIATFTGIDVGTEVKVSEIGKGDAYYNYAVTYDPAGTSDSNESGKVRVPANGHANITVTNTTTQTKNLTVEKKFMINGDDSKTEAPDKNDFKPTKFQLKQLSADGTKYENLGDAISYDDDNSQDKFKDREYTFTNLDPRKTYKVEEIFATANKGGNENSPYSHTTYIVGDGTSGNGTESAGISLESNKTVTFTNVYEKAKTSIQFTKIEEVEAGKSKPLEGAEFKIYRNEAATEEDLIATATSGQDGVVKFENLPYSSQTEATTSYYIKETKAPAGYVLSDTVYTATIAANGAVTITGGADVTTLADGTITIANTPTQITFKKMDANDKNKSIEATFKITKDEEALANFGGITDEKGCFTVNSTPGTTLTHLPDGSYELTEITAPGGYNLLTKKISFTIKNGQLSGKSENGVVEFGTDGKTVIIYNTAGIQLPETGGMGTLMTTMSGMALMLIALGYLILVKRREKGGLN